MSVSSASPIAPYDPSVSPQALAADINANPSDTNAIASGADTLAQIDALSASNASSGKDYSGSVNAGDIDYDNIPLSQLGTGPQGVGYTLLGSGLSNPGLTVDGQPISIAQQNAASNNLSNSQESPVFDDIVDAGLAAAAIYTGGAALGAWGGAEAAAPVVAGGADDYAGLLAAGNAGADAGGTAALGLTGDTALGTGALVTANDLSVPSLVTAQDFAVDAPAVSATDALGGVGADATGLAGAPGNVSTADLAAQATADIPQSSLDAFSNGFTPSAATFPDIGSSLSATPDISTNVSTSDILNGMGATSDNVANATSSSGGLTGNSSIDSALQQLGAAGSTALKYAPLAGLGLNYEAYKKGSSAASSLNSIAAPSSAVSNQLLSNYQTGTINPSDAFQISQWAQQQTAATQQYYANAGLSNSSMEAAALGQIQSQAVAMRGQALQNVLSAGLQAAGVAQGPQMAAVQASVAADNALSSASSNFINALAKMNTAGTTTTTTTTQGP